MANEDDLQVEEGKKSGKGLLIVIIVLVGAIGGGAAYFFLGGKEENSSTPEQANVTQTAEPAAVTQAPAIYVEVPEGVLVQLLDGRKTRNVQVRVSLVTRSTDAENKLKELMPLIRSELLAFWSQKSVEDFKQADKRQKLKEETAKHLQQVLTEQAGAPLIEKVLFTRFVMQ